MGAVFSFGPDGEAANDVPAALADDLAIDVAVRTAQVNKLIDVLHRIRDSAQFAVWSGAALDAPALLRLCNTEIAEAVQARDA